MKVAILILIFAISLAGCVTVPKTSSELVETASTTQTFCYAKSPEEVSKRLETFLSKCYRPADVVIPIGGIYLPLRADFQVTNEKLPNGSRYSVRNFVGFGYSANVIGGAERCEAEVKMFAVSSLWQRVFVAADIAISSGEAECS